MLTKKILPIAIASSLALGAAAASADDAISANVMLTTDYTWRGVSQTNEDAAIQGGFDYAHESGFYIGTWASNVNFGGGLDGGSTEIDVYGGYGGDINDNLSYDVGFIYYGYQSDTDLDFLEVQGALTFYGVTVGLNYSDEFGDDGPSNLYAHAEYSYSFTDNLSLDLHGGYTDTDEDDFWEDGEDSYGDWSIGLGTSYFGLDFSLAYVGTTLDDLDIYDDRAVFSISKSL
jgi:uncharacterized protein (TIGR02001 family)